MENLAPTGIRSPERPGRSQSLYRLRYLAHVFVSNNKIFTGKGHTVTQLVEALRYKPADRRFDSRWCYLNFVLQSGSLNLIESSGPVQVLLYLFSYLG